MSSQQNGTVFIFNWFIPEGLLHGHTGTWLYEMNFNSAPQLSEESENYVQKAKGFFQASVVSFKDGAVLSQK